MQLSYCNRRNIAAILRGVVKCLPVGVLEEISKFSQNLKGRARAGVLFL